MSSSKNAEITIETAAHVADLARLEIPADKLEVYRTQMAALFSYFEELAQVKTDGIEPLVTPTDIAKIWREDKVQEGLTYEEMSANAPELAGALFKVPPVV